MSDTIKNFLTIYPSWPTPLAQKFDALLPAELAAFMPEQQNSNNEFYERWRSILNTFTDSFVYNHYSSWTVVQPSKLYIAKPFLKPTSQQFTDTAELSLSISGGGLYYYDMVNRTQQVQPPIVTVTGKIDVPYDDRLFANVQITPVQLVVTANGIIFSRTSNTITFHSRFVQVFKISADKIPYDGINTIYAMYENGVEIPGVNYELAKEFVTYVNAYRKYAPQIESSATNSRQAAIDSYLDYEQSLSAQVRQEQSALENLQITASQQMVSDMQSAKRDLTNTILNAQSLAINLQRALGG